MSDEKPKYFYKYRAIYPDRNLSFDEGLLGDYAIKNLLNNEAIFSSRRNFNDLFDSKIEIIDPTPQQFKALKPLIKRPQMKEFLDSINKGKFTPEGIELLTKVRNSFNDLIDKYSFICLSNNPTSNLMWSHYADSHRGFCIEFKSEYVRANKVIYQKHIPKINSIEMCKIYFGINEGDNLGQLTWQALRTKLIEWEYESEYRFQGSAGLTRKLCNGEMFLPVPYLPEYIESIIFGCRMPQTFKDFIIEKMPPNTKFKQAIARLDYIDIIDY